MIIRNEKIEDHEAVREINLKAFPTDIEATLVDKLRSSMDTISLVAVHEDKVVGHILFSPLTIENDEESFPALILAPIAVLPEYQKQGIGSKLVENGIIECRNHGHSIIILVGHPGYYPRFGFISAEQNRIEHPFEVPEDVFMVYELVPDTLSRVNGVLKYSKPFEEFF
ncbi:GCN5-related N-acetyltransferase [Methanobacterium lacus]|uniref:GCN5-related N-acetyltransferase n=1 Tax=Methanobacterium lacus (strain AL-21) TaxID=877455 RepID=F0T815_METLA|nr:N-acetyltransferase [Methanobacterium lacus]ADZ09641.1 GCN5-related N-acetyltransferase [Methanobacterium lacus]